MVYYMWILLRQGGFGMGLFDPIDWNGDGKCDFLKEIEGERRR